VSQQELSRPSAPSSGSRRQPYRPPTPEEEVRRDLAFSISLQRLGESIEHGWKISFKEFDGEITTGYLAGMDSEYFLVYVPDPDYTVVTDDPHDGFFEKGIARGLNPTFELHHHNTFEDELSHPKMVGQVEDWRQWYAQARSEEAAVPAQVERGRTDIASVGDMPRNGKSQPSITAKPPHPQFKGA
jgi:hypothetical protein